MVSPSLEKEILDALQNLKEPDQRQVVDFAKMLARKNVPGTSGQELIQLAQGIEPEDVQLMSDAIADGCEQVDLSGW